MWLGAFRMWSLPKKGKFCLKGRPIQSNSPIFSNMALFNSSIPKYLSHRVSNKSESPCIKHHPKNCEISDSFTQLYDKGISHPRLPPNVKWRKWIATATNKRECGKRPSSLEFLTFFPMSFSPSSIRFFVSQTLDFSPRGLFCGISDIPPSRTYIGLSSGRGGNSSPTNVHSLLF